MKEGGDGTATRTLEAANGLVEPSMMIPYKEGMYIARTLIRDG
jgi:hypothetical protein